MSCGTADRGNIFRAKRWLRGSIWITVLLAVSWTAAQAVAGLAEQPISLQSIGLPWLALSGLFYLFSMLSGWFFWHRTIAGFGYELSPRETCRAFLASQLGKYVPGKAMVVAIRATHAADRGVPMGIGAASVFVETLTWVAVGAALGAVLMVLTVGGRSALVLLGLLMAVTAAIPTFPPVFRRICRLFKLDRAAIERLNWRLIGQGWCILIGGWALNGLSFWCVLNAVPDTLVTANDYWLCLTCATLSTVVGFVSMIPVGLGVRELVTVPLIGSRFGLTVAVVSAVLMRIVWITIELLSVTIMTRHAQTHRKRRPAALSEPLNESPAQPGLVGQEFAKDVSQRNKAA